jgi:hypothetical protein
LVRAQRGRATDFANLMQGDSDVKGLTLWVDGKGSDRARQELKSRKIDLATAFWTNRSDQCKTTPQL